jgi:oxygen-independent coproporphyrinogen III oxidase
MFLSGVEEELALVGLARPVDTVFWGGGTPGLLAPKDLTRLGEAVRAHTGGAPGEWSVEMAPASVTEARLQALRDVGVTRISMGAQSFQPELLDALGRQHTREQIFRAYDRVRQVGFASVNLDLMFALPGQDEAAWLQDLEQALALAPDHLSTYCLTFEEDTRLWVKLSQGKVKLDAEFEARLYQTTWDRLEAAGYHQYEVSNFARPGHVCRHNLNTWLMQEWVGVGPSAASQFGGWRGANVADLDAWRSGITRGERATEDRVRLTPALLAEDSLIFGLRLNDGVDLRALRERFPSVSWAAVEGIVQRFVDDGLAVQQAERLRLTRRGRLVADSVGGAVMEAMAAAAPVETA